MKLLNILKWLFIIVVIALAVSWLVNKQLSATVTAELSQSAQYKEGKFYNTKPRKKYGLGRFAELAGFYLTTEKIDTVPTKAIPVKNLTRRQLDALSDDELYLTKLGHSSILLKVYGEYWLIDPVFADRASPFSFIGPQRFHQPPITIAELPAIDRVLISHNHYDHLDKTAIQKLIPKTQ